MDINKEKIIIKPQTRLKVEKAFLIEFPIISPKVGRLRTIFSDMVFAL